MAILKLAGIGLARLMSRTRVQPSIVLVAAGLMSLIAAPAIAEPTIDCTIPLQVVCDVQDPQGIARITVTVPTGMGPVDVVDQQFTCVSNATVSWDPIVPGYEIFVDTCVSEPGSTAGVSGFSVMDQGGEFASALPLDPEKRDVTPIKLPSGALVVRGRGGLNELIALCDQREVSCGERGEACFVQSPRPRARCPGVTISNLSLGLVCDASC